MGYPKPNKEQRNKDFLRLQGIQPETNPYYEEKVEQKKLFLIICEGENTERYYFESFPVPSGIVIVEGGCNSKTALVEYALTKQKEFPEREIWCVYDYDKKPDEKATQPEDFNKSIEIAEANGLKVAWSNDAFELWFLLHYQYVDTALSRHEIYPKLKEKWPIHSFHKEAKTPAFCKQLYKLLGGTKSNEQELAIRHSKNLHQQYADRTDYAAQCPCTTVYMLVQELNRNLKP